MSEEQEKMWDALSELSSEDVIRAFTNYHGMQLLDDGFYEFMQDEGYLPEDEEEEETFYCPVCGCEWDNEEDAESCCKEETEEEEE